MTSYSKEQNKSCKESDFILFSLKGNYLLFNKELNEMNNKSMSNIKINNDRKINENKADQNFPLTNLIFRERIKTSKPKLRINQNINEINKMDNNNEQLLNTQKLKVINSKKFIKKVNKSRYPIIHFENTKVFKRNMNTSNFDKKIYKVMEQIQKPKKVSKDQQTYQDNEIKILNYNNQRKTIIVRKPINNFIKLEEYIKARKNKKKKKEKKMENKEDEQITDYMNNINLNNINKIDYYQKKNFHNTINANEIYKMPKSKIHLNKTQRIFKNHSNKMNIKYLSIEESRENKSLREICRSLLLIKNNNAKKKEIKSLLKNKHILECINKNEKPTRKFLKRPYHYHNLVSLENFSQYSKKNKSTKNVYLKNNNEENMIKDIKLLNKKKHCGTIYINKLEDNENFFGNILKSFSRAKERINKVKIKKNESKNSLINIHTMLELNNKSNKVF